MSTKHIRVMGDFMRFGMDIAVECECGHKTVLPWLPVLMRFHQKGWSHNLAAARRHFRCAKCGEHPAHIGPHRRD